MSLDLWTSDETVVVECDYCLDGIADGAGVAAHGDNAAEVLFHHPSCFADLDPGDHPVGTMADWAFLFTDPTEAEEAEDHPVPRLIIELLLESSPRVSRFGSPEDLERPAAWIDTNPEMAALSELADALDQRGEA